MKHSRHIVKTFIKRYRSFSLNEFLINCFLTFFLVWKATWTIEFLPAPWRVLFANRVLRHFVGNLKKCNKNKAWYLLLLLQHPYHLILLLILPSWGFFIYYVFLIVIKDLFYLFMNMQYLFICNIQTWRKLERHAVTLILACAFHSDLLYKNDINCVTVGNFDFRK